MSIPSVPPIDLAPLEDLAKDVEKQVEKNARRFLRTATRVATTAVAATVSRRAVQSILRIAHMRQRKSTRRSAWVAAGVGAAALGLAGWQLQRLFTAEPEYELEERRNALEIRRYAPMKTAHTTVAEPWDRALDQGFRRLAGFIFGGNADRTRIAMTAPVTAVGVNGEAGYRVSFVMPEGVALPAPDDAQITFTEIPARRVAVLRFRGRCDSASIEAKKRELLAEVEEAGYLPLGEAAFAGYDPPSTLPALRRNEVWVEIGG